jgi:hypothetical protein
MLLDKPEQPAEKRGFVHKRILGGIGGFLGGGPLGAISGFIGGGGGSPTVPSGPTDFTTGLSQPRVCVPPWRMDPLTGQCKIFAGDRPGPDAAPYTQTNGRAPFVGYAHHPHAPQIVPTEVRRCDKGHVLSWEGMCVSKRDIRNSDRMYPKPPRPLGTRGDLRAVRTASAFGRRLKGNEKRLKKLVKNLGGR